MKGLFGQGPKEEEDRFKYDFANSRWVRHVLVSCEWVNHAFR